jgi:hypothetical protein
MNEATAVKIRETQRAPEQPVVHDPPRSSMTTYPDLARLQHDAGNQAINQMLAPVVNCAPLRVPDLLQTGRGQPLDPDTRFTMESYFAQDFRAVRVHTDSLAALTAVDMGASAYTLGDQIVFADGKFTPSTPSGKRLLAHELAHVIQQRRGGALSGLAGSAHLEYFANRAATSVEQGRQPDVVDGKSPLQIACQAEPESSRSNRDGLAQKYSDNLVTVVDNEYVADDGVLTWMTTKIMSTFLLPRPYKLALSVLDLAAKSNILPLVLDKLRKKPHPMSGNYMDALEHLLLTRGNKEIRDRADAIFFGSSGMRRPSDKSVLCMSEEQRKYEAAARGVPGIPDEILRQIVAGAPMLLAFWAIFRFWPTSWLARLAAVTGAVFTADALSSGMQDMKNWLDISKNAQNENDLTSAGKYFKRGTATLGLIELCRRFGRAGRLGKSPAPESGQLAAGTGFTGSWFTRLGQSLRARIIVAWLKGAEPMGSAVLGETSSALPVSGQMTKVPSNSVVIDTVKAMAEPMSIKSDSPKQAPLSAMSKPVPSPAKSDTPLTIAPPPPALVANSPMSESIKRTPQDEFNDFIQFAQEECGDVSVERVKSRKIEDTRVPKKPRSRMDIENLPLQPGETQREAVARVMKIIGQKISLYKILENLWNDAKSMVLQKETLTEDNYKDLYDRVRDAFWRRVAGDPVATKLFKDAGIGFSEKGLAPILLNVDPEVPIEEIRVSLDHVDEKAQGDNWQKALDADNLRMEFAGPNTERENKQMRHPELRKKVSH